MKHLSWLLAFVLTACGTPIVATSPATPQAIHIFYPASLHPWAEMLSICAATDPHIAAYFTQVDGIPTEIQSSDLVLHLGQPSQPTDSYYLDQVGWDQVVVVVNQANPIDQLSIEQLSGIFTGQTVNWKEGSGKPIQVWVLPDDEPTRQIFDTALRLSKPLAPDSRLAPDPAAMITAISRDPNAIGYLPQSFLKASGAYNSDKVKIVNLDTPLKENLHQPVIAITQAEPEGDLRSLVICLQNTNP